MRRCRTIYICGLALAFFVAVGVLVRLSLDSKDRGIKRVVASSPLSHPERVWSYDVGALSLPQFESQKNRPAGPFEFGIEQSPATPELAIAEIAESETPTYSAIAQLVASSQRPHARCVLAGSIVFVSSRRGGGDAVLCRINADGTGLHNLTSRRREILDCDWSPDGRRIAFVEARDGVATINLFERIVEPFAVELMNVSSMSWSPDGAKLAVSLGSGQEQSLHVLDRERNELQLLHERGESPSWSPDGRQIAFICDGRLSLVNPDGTNAHAVFASPVNERDTPLDSAPCWSSDGRSLMFSSINRWTRIDGRDTDSGMHVYLTDALGHSLLRITNGPGADVALAWSPDDRAVLVSSDRDGQRDVYILGLASGGMVRLTNDTREEWAASWAGGTNREMLAER